jgi:hypothetical protein
MVAGIFRGGGAIVKIFISYARLNMTTAEALVRDLHALGHQAFYDQDLTGGQRWWDTLLDQIQAADVFVPVLSDEYRESQACRVEAEWADALHVSFLPVFTEDQLPGMYDPIIAEANWVGYDAEDRGALADLARGVSSVTERTPPEPLPPRPPIPLSYLVMVEREIRGEDELGRHRQLAIVSDLRSKLGTRESSGARELLQALRERPDVTFEVATTVDALLASPDPVGAEPAAGAGPRPADLAATPTRPPTPAARTTGADRRTEPTAPPATGPPAVASSLAAKVLSVTGALLAFLAVGILPWVITADSDSRTWYGFFDVMSFTNPSEMDLGGWVIGIVVCAAIATVVLVLVATHTRAVAAGSRIAAVVGAVLVSVLGIAAAHEFTNGDEALRTSAGPWLLAIGSLLMGVVLLKPSIGGGRTSSKK